MDKRKRNWITWGFVVLAVLVAALMLSRSFHRTTHITLPESGGGQNPAGESDGDDGGDLTLVEITPETVQYAIASLSRPEHYRRTVTVEQFWSGGSGRYEFSTAVSGPWTRTDRSMPGGQVRHVLTDGQETYIWYGETGPVYTAPAGDISGDDEQNIPTYEDILRLPAEEIAEADYRVLMDMNCIYVETAEDPEGYMLRYWVSVDSGLLSAAEKLRAGETVYRMAAPNGDQSEPDPADFTLPDGRVLLETE